MRYNKSKIKVENSLKESEMKKTILWIGLITIIVMSMLVFAACSGEVNVPGAAWARSETLTYDIIENDKKIGTMVTHIEKLDSGSVELTEVREKPFNITASMKGIKMSQKATDLDGKVIMESVSLLNGVESLASYKMMDYGKKYSVRSYFEGKKYHYSVDNGGWKSVKAKAGFVDNNLIYTMIRGYDFSGGYSQSLKVFAPTTGKSEDISVAITNALKPKFEFNYIDVTGEIKTEEVECFVGNFTKSSAPVGSSIEVWYTNPLFKLHGRGDVSAGNYSYNIPVKIVENNLSYELVSAKAE